MSRSGYTDDGDDWAAIRWRGAVASAIRGKRGQAFLKEMLSALDEIPNKRLIRGDLVADGDVCALGAVGVKRALPGLLDIDPYDPDIAGIFSIPTALASEIMYINDEAVPYYWVAEKPEDRWQRVREWVASKITATD